MLVINESGLYSLILTSRKPAAKRFKSWVTSEVLPAIRKTGSYSASSQNPKAEPQKEGDIQHLRDMVEAQAAIIKQGQALSAKSDENRRIIREFAAILIDNTNLTDHEIADQMEGFLEENMPEWVAWRRRKASA